MNICRARVVSIAVALGCLAIDGVWAQGVQTQKSPSGMDQKKSMPTMQQSQQQLTLPGQCTTADKVAVTDLTLNPAQPKQGQAVVVTLTIKNLCSVPLARVAWQIASTPDNTILGSGVVQAAIPAGQSVTVTAPWNAVPGQRGFDGRADPANLLRESAGDQANNRKTASINVPQMSASRQGAGGAAPRLVTQMLNYDKAKNAGGRFTNNLDPNTVGCLGTGQFSPANAPSGGADASVAVVFRMSCLAGARASPEAFTGNFKLQNGWKIKRVEPVIEHVKDGVDWQWDTRPTEGSDVPAMKMVLDGFGSALGRNKNATLYVKVVIEGPEGTDPYVASAR